MSEKFTAEIEGAKETLNALEKKFGKTQVRKITRKAVNLGAGKVEKKLQQDMEVFKDQGYSIDEVVKTTARYRNEVVEAEIGWNGPKERYRLIHLNEWGYTRNGRQIRPRGFGVITKSLANSGQMYLDTVYEEVKKSL